MSVLGCFCKNKEGKRKSEHNAQREACRHPGGRDVKHVKQAMKMQNILSLRPKEQHIPDVPLRSGLNRICLLLQILPSVNGHGGNGLSEIAQLT